MFVAGLWRNRSADAGAPMLVHGATTAGSRYVGFSTNPFSQQVAEQEWLLIGQAALWSDLTDEGWRRRGRAGHARPPPRNARA